MNMQTPCERKLKSEMVYPTTQILIKSWGGHFHFIPNGVQKNIRCNLLDFLNFT
jgi:hypothetical protein